MVPGVSSSTLSLTLSPYTTRVAQTCARVGRSPRRISTPHTRSGGPRRRVSRCEWSSRSSAPCRTW
eukprot:369824-Pyramimonas_sp.AAC.1